jgi:phosphoribosylglycinamide formyltransferase-1
MGATGGPMGIVVLISGSGTNLQAILDAQRRGDIPVRVLAVISDQPEAYGLQRARAAGVPSECIDARGYPDRESYDAALGERLAALAPGLVVLAGFMRILSPPLVGRWSGRMLNVHPSLLPAYRGLHTHRRVLEAGERHHGTSVHFVTEELDGGPVIAQARLVIRPGDSEEDLKNRIQALEHLIYPEVVGWFATGRLRMQGDKVVMDGTVLPGPIVRDEQAPQARGSVTPV